MSLTLAEIEFCESTVRVDISNLIEAVNRVGVTTMELELNTSVLKKMVLAQITSEAMFDDCVVYLKIAYIKGLKERDRNGISRSPYEIVKYCLTEGWTSRKHLTPVQQSDWDYYKSITDQTTRFFKALRMNLVTHLRTGSSDNIAAGRKYNNLTLKFFTSRGYSLELAELYSKLPMTLNCQVNPKLMVILESLKTYYVEDEENEGEEDADAGADAGAGANVAADENDMPRPTSLFVQSNDIETRKRTRG